MGIFKRKRDTEAGYKLGGKSGRGKGHPKGWFVTREAEGQGDSFVPPSKMPRRGTLRSNGWE